MFDNALNTLTGTVCDATHLFNKGTSSRVKRLERQVTRSTNSKYLILHLFGLSGTEQHGLPLLWKELYDLMHFLLKPLLQDSVSLVNHQHLHVAEQEALRILKTKMDKKVAYVVRSHQHHPTESSQPF